MTAYILKLVSGGNDLAALIFGIVVLFALLFVGDHLIERRPFFGRPFWALVDSGVHGLVALLVTAPIIHSASTAQQGLILLALASHVLRDAAVGTAPVLWPLGDWRVPGWAYWLGEVGLVVASYWVAERGF